MATLTVNDSQLRAYILSLSTVERRMYNTGLKFVKVMTEYAEKRMKLHAPSRTKRSTGKLRSGIASEVSPTTNSVRGVAFVNSNVKYQFVIERGQKGGGRIQGNPQMSFPVASWKKASKNPALAATSYNGMFSFSSVKRGKYKGKFFTQKAFEDLHKYYEKIKSKHMFRFIQNIGFNR